MGTREQWFYFRSDGQLMEHSENDGIVFLRKGAEGKLQLSWILISFDGRNRSSSWVCSRRPNTQSGDFPMTTQLQEVSDSSTGR